MRGRYAPQGSYQGNPGGGSQAGGHQPLRGQGNYNGNRQQAARYGGGLVQGGRDLMRRYEGYGPPGGYSRNNPFGHIQPPDPNNGGQIEPRNNGGNHVGTYNDFENHERKFHHNPRVIRNAFSIGLSDGLIQQTGQQTGEKEFDFSKLVAKAGENEKYTLYLNGGKMNWNYPIHGREDMGLDEACYGRSGYIRR